jgi:hypothetical protein
LFTLCTSETKSTPQMFSYTNIPCTFYYKNQNFQKSFIPNGLSFPSLWYTILEIISFYILNLPQQSCFNQLKKQAFYSGILKILTMYSMHTKINMQTWQIIADIGIRYSHVLHIFIFNCVYQKYWNLSKEIFHIHIIFSSSRGLHFLFTSLFI